MSTAGEGSEAQDPMFVDSFVDIDEWRDAPVRHRYVHGGYHGTDLRFSFYFPPAEQYAGRFHHPVRHIAGTDNGGVDGVYDGMGGSLAFTFASGAYLVESNMGSFIAHSASDPTITFRASAAAARYSRVLAAEMYGPHRPFGYIWGGSGGAFKSMACIEATTGVWDGAVPFVQGTPMSIPNVFSVQAHAMRLLWDKLPQIVDAVDPGGGDMYAGLTVEEREALAEVTRFGFPPRAWFDANRVRTSYTMLWTIFADIIRMLDPTYFTDFWTVPGYLGANPPASLLAARFRHETTIARVVLANDADASLLPQTLVRTANETAGQPIALRSADLPAGSLHGASLEFRTGAAAGRRLYVMDVVGDLIVHSGGDPAGLSDVLPGDEVVIDNTDYLAFQTYHRHQTPGSEYPAWHQFVVGGQPIYPQRALHIGPLLAWGGAGAMQTGKFAGKMIVMESMIDEAAYPWQADWYRQQVAAHLGDRIDDQYRLWFIDHAMHGAPTPVQMFGDDLFPERTNRTISYQGVLEQALRDIAAWVEQGVAPPSNTRYEIVDGQVVLPVDAADRGGLQAVVALSVDGADGADRADVAVGTSVTFHATIEVPEGAGTVVAVEWDYLGDGTFESVGDGVLATSAKVALTTRYTFTGPGTYFTGVRAFSQREGDAATPHARVANLARVRVVVV